MPVSTPPVALPRDLRQLCLLNSWTYDPPRRVHPGRAQRVLGHVLVDTSARRAAAEPRAKRSPSTWIVQDDLLRRRRLIAIQGTNSAQHWKQNLSFGPRAFLHSCLETYVHRGCYDAALQLFDILQVYVAEAHALGLREVVLTGHSIGGSIAVLLKLMLHYWKVPQPDVITAVAFGSPAIFCPRPAAASSPAAANHPQNQNPYDRQFNDALLLSRMSVPADSIVNVVLHRDIVPRAFSCDYSVVRDVLNILPAFAAQTHMGDPRTRRRPHVYSFMGQMHVLQPPPTLPKDRAMLAAGQWWHPLLPPEPGLYAVAPGDHAFVERFMDDPHPLDVLLPSPVAALKNGNVMRFHSIDYYAQALKGVRPVARLP
jgi:hypothetical protein